MTVFLDTCVVIALLNEKDHLHEWSCNEFAKCKVNGPVVICDIVYCEASVGMKSRADLDKEIELLGIERIRIPDDALFKAGKVFQIYRRQNKGAKTGVLPDFLIGATAEVYSAPLMTDNVRDFANYFNRVNFISPAP